MSPLNDDDRDLGYLIRLRERSAIMTIERILDVGLMIP